MAKKSKTRVFGRIFSMLCIIIAIFTGGYFFLDKVIIPKYFGSYGINNVTDLVGIVTSLYKSPNEEKLITNGYTQQDLTSAIKDLQQAGYKIADDGTIDEKNFNIFEGNKRLELTDREFAAVCNKLISNGILVDVLSDLNYINLSKISILEVVMTPVGEISSDNLYMQSNISFIAKIETEGIRDQIAKHMETPEFLLNMIIPDVIYFSVSYDFDLEKTEDSRVTNGLIAINGRTSEQSKILINLLVDFIFPDEENMNLEKFTETLGDIILQGIDVLGEFKFAKQLGTVNNQNGIVVNPNL